MTLQFVWPAIKLYKVDGQDLNQCHSFDYSAYGGEPTLLPFIMSMYNIKTGQGPKPKAIPWLAHEPASCVTKCSPCWNACHRKLSGTLNVKAVVLRCFEKQLKIRLHR